MKTKGNKLFSPKNKSRTKLAVYTVIFAATGLLLLYMVNAAPNDSSTLPLLGVYDGGPPSTDDGYAKFGRYPEIASTYYQANQTQKPMEWEKPRIDRGTRPLTTITSKGTQYIPDIANKSGAGWTWIQEYANSLKQVNDYAKTKNVTVYATLDHEWEVKVNQGLLTGQAADEATYAKALSNFFTLIKSQSPEIVTLYWYGHSDTAAINSVGSKLTVKPDMYSLDPYSGSHHANNETFYQTGKSKVDWLKSRSWYNGEPIAFSEFGANHSDADMAQYFFKDLRLQAQDLGLAFALFFNRNDGIYVVAIDPNNYPLSTAAFRASMAYVGSSSPISNPSTNPTQSSSQQSNPKISTKNDTSKKAIEEKEAEAKNSLEATSGTYGEPRSYLVEITLKDKNGLILANTDVRLSKQGLDQTATTDENGRVKFIGVAPGHYNLYVQTAEGEVLSSIEVIEDTNDFQEFVVDLSQTGSNRILIFSITSFILLAVILAVLGYYLKRSGRFKDLHYRSMNRIKGVFVNQPKVTKEKQELEGSNKDNPSSPVSETIIKPTLDK